MISGQLATNNASVIDDISIIAVENFVTKIIKLTKEWIKNID